MHCVPLERRVKPQKMALLLACALRLLVAKQIPLIRSPLSADLMVSLTPVSVD